MTMHHLLQLSSSSSSSSPTTTLSNFQSDLEDTSLENLQRRMVRLIQKYGQECRLSVAMAGGGGTFLSTLASTPGASQILLQGIFLYDRESYRRFVKRNLDGESFKYASYESSQYAAEAALTQGLALAAAVDPLYGHFPINNLSCTVAIGTASALSSNDGNHNNNNNNNNNNTKRSRAYSTVMTSDSFRVTLEAHLARTGGKNLDRTRFEEDLFTAHCILTSLEYTLYIRQHLPLLMTNGNGNTHFHDKITTQRGDSIRIQATFDTKWTTQAVLRKAAQFILNGERDSVLLVPKSSSTTTPTEKLSHCQFQIIQRTVLPPRSLIFPGSFHPPHQGHVQLAEAALKATECEIVWFELSLTNADKPALELDDVVDRVTAFLRLREDMPILHWGILLTNAPLFRQKVDLLHPLQVSRRYDEISQTEILPSLHFAIGTDTLVRILNPKYYDNSYDTMVATLRAMPCHFVVGGRLEQLKEPSERPSFVSGQENVESLPEDLRAKFTLLPGFRVDISSSEIRRQLSRDGSDVSSEKEI